MLGVVALVTVTVATALAATGAGVKAPVKLHGVMRFKGNFVLKKGARYLVTRKTTIIADGSVVVDAPVQVARGAGLTIVARGIRNAAPITPAPGPRRTAGLRGSEGSGCPKMESIRELSFGIGIEVDDPIIGEDGGTAPDGNGCPGQDVWLYAVSSAVQSALGGFNLSNYLHPLDPSIAEFSAEETANFVAHFKGAVVIAALLSIPSGVITVHAKIHGGNGGAGAVVRSARGGVNPCRRSTAVKPPAGPQAGQTYAVGGKGGRGGDVELDTLTAGLNGGIGTGSGSPDETDLRRVDSLYVRPGKGGAGGTVDVTAPDGGDREGGGSAYAASGDGGDGGLSSLLVRYLARPNQKVFRAGEGGAPGSITIHAGNGGSSNCDGGDAFAGVGRPGRPPEIPGGGRPTRPETEPTGVKVTGGNGNPGPSTDPGDRAGGDGGAVFVFGEPGKPAYAKVFGIGISGAGNGGLGFDGCPSSSPGGAGGSGGSLQVHGVASVITGSFNGGNGNQGVGPGEGGVPGSRGVLSTAPAQAEEIKGSFLPGREGGHCPQAVRITETDTWAHNASLGKSNVCLDVATTPPQAYVSAELTGPGGFDAKTDGKAPLHPDGTAQIRATITQAGSYTDTLTVYDQNGNQTATSTNTFTVKPPPDNGPEANPPCQAPTG